MVWPKFLILQLKKGMSSDAVGMVDPFPLATSCDLQALLFPELD